MSKLYTVKGINDDQDTCDICGKENLKRVVWLEDTETLELIACGTTCAAKLQGIKVAEQKKMENDFVKASKEALRKARYEAIQPLQTAFDDALSSIPCVGDNGFTYSNRMDAVRALPEYVALKLEEKKWR